MTSQQFAAEAESECGLMDVYFDGLYTSESR